MELNVRSVFIQFSFYDCHIFLKVEINPVTKTIHLIRINNQRQQIIFNQSEKILSLYSWAFPITLLNYQKRNVYFNTENKSYSLTRKLVYYLNT